MPIVNRVAAALGLSKREADTTGTMPEGIKPPARSTRITHVSNDQALGLIDIYRAIQILVFSASQITFHGERAGRRLAPTEESSFLKRPCTTMDNAEFVEYLILSLLFDGNAYLKPVFNDAGAVLDVVALPPSEVRPFEVKDVRDGSKTTWYGYAGATYSAYEIRHMSLMKLPGSVRGLGPIQAAQVDIRGAIELRDYAALWFSEGKIPSGILTSEQVLTKADAQAFKAAWNGTQETPAENPSGVKVLGKGTTYSPILLKPADAQWLESQQFTTTQLARLFGVPASLMLAAVQGSSMTYANVEQDWLAFTRFTLMGYLRKIEIALTDLAPRGQTVRFNVDALLRSDTKSRYDAHKVAIDAGFLVDDEVREIEGKPPLTPEQRAIIAARKVSPTPPKEGEA